MKSKTGVRKEIWNHTAVVVARNKKGKIETWKKLARGFNLQRAKSIYKDNGTFKENLIRKEHKNFVEWEQLEDSNAVVVKQKNVSDSVFRPKVKIEPFKTRKNKMVQYVVRLYPRDKSEPITARSNKYDISISNAEDKARDEAWQGALERLAQREGLDYEASEGESIYDDIIAKAKEGRVIYVQRTQVEA